MAEPLPQELIEALLNDSANLRVKHGFEDVSRAPGAPSERVEEAFNEIPQERGDYLDLSSGSSPNPKQFVPLYTGPVNDAGIQAFIENALESTNVEDRRNEDYVDALKRFVDPVTGQYNFTGRGPREVTEEEYERDQEEGRNALSELIRLSR